MDKACTDIAEAVYDTSEMGIFAMSSQKDSILMWSHYGDSHKGICIGYDYDDFFRTKQCFPVRYKKKLPVIEARRCYRNWEFLPYLWKHYAWNYEKEWRYMSPEFIDEEIPSPASIRGLYLGARVNNDVVKMLRKEVKLQVPLYRAILNEENFYIPFIWEEIL